MATESRWSPPIVSAPTENAAAISVELKYETPDWEAIYEIRAVDGRPAIASVRIAPRTRDDLDRPVPPELTATLARELLRPGEAVQRVRAYLADDLIVASASVLPMMRELLDRYHDPRPRQGRRRSDRFYAWLAARYLEQVASGSHSPVKDTAERLGDNYDAKFVRDALMRARKRKLLTHPSSPNKAGGCLTQLGREALEQGRA